ncbi:hypothetical protein FRC07_004304 [Ceratobasidium sp. 392]|nr:hypothetical protein FRC07_004304 [Ceratobasidium sp. 392]
MSNNLTSAEPSSRPYCVATYQGRAVAIKRDANYENTIKLLQKSIPKLRSADIRDIFISTTIPEYDDTLVQISEDIWPDFVDQVKDVEVTLEGSENEVIAGVESLDTRRAQRQTTRNLAADGFATTSTRSSDPITLTIHTTSQRVLTYSELLPSTMIRDIKSLIETDYGVPAALLTLDLRDKPLQDTITLEQAGITNGIILGLELNTRRTIIHFRGVVSGKTPVKNVKIQLSLNRNWELAALFRPEEGPNKDYIQSMAWNINVLGNDDLHDNIGGKDQSWLFWDGIISSVQSSVIDPLPPLDRPEELSPSIEVLRDITAVRPDNSEAVPIGQVYSYVSTMIAVLQNEFDNLEFTRWFATRVASGLHTHVALRCLPQSDYHAIAPLSVSQGSGISMFRLMILFKRLSNSAALFWDAFHPMNYHPDTGSPVWNSVIGDKPIVSESNHPTVHALEISCMEVF